MTTGIDAQTCKLIVLDSNINSMTEFKQIIGRGTRINEEYNKFYLTILDFRNVTRLFADPDFDGDPVMIKVVDPEDEISPLLKKKKKLLTIPQMKLPEKILYLNRLYHTLTDLMKVNITREKKYMLTVLMFQCLMKEFNMSVRMEA